MSRIRQERADCEIVDRSCRGDRITGNICNYPGTPAGTPSPTTTKIGTVPAGTITQIS